jgi:hypothetical protein
MKKTATPTPTQTKRNSWVELDRSAMNALVYCGRMRQGKKGARPWRRRDLLAVLGDLENHGLAQRGANSLAKKSCLLCQPLVYQPQSRKPGGEGDLANGWPLRCAFTSELCPSR